MQVQAIDHTEAETAGRLYRLMQLAYKLEAQLIAADDFPPLRRTVEAIASADSVFYACIEQQELLAAIELACNEKALQIVSLVVNPQYARRGLGAALVRQAIEQSLAGDNAKDLLVQTAHNNRAAVALYQKLGFQLVRQFTTNDGFELVEFRY